MTDITYPITVSEVRDWCRIDGELDDALLQNLIIAGTAYAGAYLGTNLFIDLCPAPVRQAIAVFVADNYANREGQLVGSQAVQILLAPYRSAL